jgi:hypothetical protein
MLLSLQRCTLSFSACFSASRDFHPVLLVDGTDATLDPTTSCTTTQLYQPRTRTLNDPLERPKDQKKKKAKTSKIMDPFSSDGELVNIHTAFIQGQYQLVLSDFNPSDFSESNRLAVQILQHRAQIELGNASEVLSAVPASKASSSPDLAAVRIYATFASKRGPYDDATVAEAEKLAEQQGENLTVQLLCGTVLARAGKQELALQLLAKHQGSLDAVALIVQIHLSQNRTDLAVKEAKGARSFAQDALLVNLAESWVGIRQVQSSGDKCES